MTEFEYNVLHQLKIHNKLKALEIRNKHSVVGIPPELDRLEDEINKTIRFPSIRPTNVGLQNIIHSGN